MGVKSLLKKAGSKVKSGYHFLGKHKKAVLGTVALGTAGTLGAMYLGYVPTPEVLTSAAQVVTQTIADHPTESLIAGSVAAGAVGGLALKTGISKVKNVRKVLKSIPSVPKKLASEAVAKAKELVGKGGGEVSSQTEEKVDWEKDEWIIKEK